MVEMDNLTLSMQETCISGSTIYFRQRALAVMPVYRSFGITQHSGIQGRRLFNKPLRAMDACNSLGTTKIIGNKTNTQLSLSIISTTTPSRATSTNGTVVTYMGATAPQQIISGKLAYLRIWLTGQHHCSTLILVCLQEPYQRASNHLH